MRAQVVPADEQASMATARRFWNSGGDLMDRLCPERRTLAWAAEQQAEWEREARHYRQLGNARVARLYERDAQALRLAAIDVANWRRAAGWTPEGAAA